MVRHPETVSGDLGDSVTLHCDVDSNPPPKFTWTRGTSRQVRYNLGPHSFNSLTYFWLYLSHNWHYCQAVGSSQNLTLIVSERTEGQYYCHSITEGYDLLTSQPASILLRRQPSITSPKIQTGVEGDITRVKCQAVSAPTPSGVIWTYLGRTIHSGGLCVVLLHYLSLWSQLIWNS